MKRLMIAALESGSGKTSITCALILLLQKHGYLVQSFKCGPDYIDPMFHQCFTKTSSRNLDLFLQGRQGVLETVGRSQADWVILESAMGYYDGVGGTIQNSAWEVADLLHSPVLLILNPKGSALTLASQVRGVLDYRCPSRIVGLFLNRCSQGFAEYLAPILVRETGLPVVGYLPELHEASLPSRHLGLFTALEISDLKSRIELLYKQMEKTTDIQLLCSLCKSTVIYSLFITPKKPTSCRIAVAMDDAFSFYYQDSLDALERAGAELCLFSPLRGELPVLPVHGLYLGGGYPELYAEKLSFFSNVLAWIRQSIDSGMPTVAECGGMLYLQQSLSDEGGTAYPMCGVLPGCGFSTGRLQRFGYLTLKADEDSLLFRKGEAIPAHEFHYWDTTDNGSALLAEKPVNHRPWRCGFVSPTLYAGFPHLYLNDTLAQRFIAAACHYKAYVDTKT